MDIRGTRLWKPSDEAREFTSSMSVDGRIARHVIAVNMAHMAALMDSGEVDRTAGRRIVKFLLAASPEIPRGTKAEDFHQQLEQQAVDELGIETAGFMNYGKSRNDQVATAIRMELRVQLLQMVSGIADLQKALLSLIGKKGGALLPGYTHLQRAQPVTLAHHFSAHFDAFQRDAERALQLYARVNLSPMGAAAMAGTSVKVDRKTVAHSLGFGGIVSNAMDAVSSRDVAVEALSCATIIMLDASRLAEELILWSSSEFGFIELADAYAASSSIMPQKKNAVSAEMVRAKAGSVMGDLVAACAILKALPYSYNLDLQEVTPQLWRALDDTRASLGVLAGMVATASLKEGAVRRSLKDDGSTAVALANHLVKEHHISFRQAHAITGELARISSDSGKPLQDVVPSKLGGVSAKFGKRVTLTPDGARRILDPGRFLGEIATEGGSNPRAIAAGLRTRGKELELTRSELSELKSALKESERKLNATASGKAREVKSKG